MVSFFLEGAMSVALPILISIIFVIIIFLLVVYAEGIYVNIPITLGYGFGTRFPIKFLYVSNMPIILASALYANIQLFATAAKGTIFDLPASFIGWLTSVPRIEQFSLVEALVTEFFNPGTIPAFDLGFEIFHAIVYLIILMGICIVFGRFWIDLANQGSDAVAEQLIRSGMSIPGYRKDPRILKRLLDRYIPPITILGSAFVAFLAGLADLTVGTLTTGTGILLTVGIVYRLYEEIAREQIIASHPIFRKFFA